MKELIISILMIALVVVEFNLCRKGKWATAGIFFGAVCLMAASLESPNILLEIGLSLLNFVKTFIKIIFDSLNKGGGKLL